MVRQSQHCPGRASRKTVGRHDGQDRANGELVTLCSVYDTFLLEFPEYLDLIKRVTSQVGNARRCLDLGAGTGNGTVCLLKGNPNREVWAVEINDTMLRNFRAKLEASGLNDSES